MICARGSNQILMLALLTTLAMTAPAAATHAPDTKDTMPLTTNSEEARKLVDIAWELDLDQVEQEQAAEMLRKAVQLDPDFAVAHELLAETSLDPAEQVREQKRALETKHLASPPEQLLIQWWQDAADHKLISAITEMNDVLAKYPRDRWVVFLSTLWLINQTQYERAVAVYEKSGINDSPGLMNNTAYAFAYMHQFDSAYVLMDKYAAALPKDANPQDSYAEILRMAGKFEKAIEHYQAALKIDPQFYSSEFGIADTYSLMGDQTRAREEYEIAFKKFSLPELHEVQWKTREAMTYVRENDIKGADKAFQAIADHAHAKHMSGVEADTYRQMAIYQANPRRALWFLAKADTAIHEGQNALHAALRQQQAQVLRARVEIAIQMHDQASASRALTQLAKMSNNSSDRLIEVAHEGAAGAMAFSKRKYQDAISHLEEDVNNPRSLKLLAEAYEKIGATADAKHTGEKLASMNDPTLEQALVVPAFRKCFEDPACNSSNIKPVSMKK